jgi:hypothetical protein
MKNLNILIINLPPNGLVIKEEEDLLSARHYIYPPMGLFYLTDRIVGKVKDIGVLDYNLFEQNFSSRDDYVSFIEDTLRRSVSMTNPDVICISLEFSSSYDFFEALA